MKVSNHLFDKQSGWQPAIPSGVYPKVSLLLCFGSADLMYSEGTISDLKHTFPNAELVGCTSGVEVFNNELRQDTLTLTAIQFDSTTVGIAKHEYKTFEDGYEVGKKLMQRLQEKSGLKHVFILSDSINVCGTKLIEGCNAALPANVAVTGGMASSVKPNFSDIYFALKISAMRLGLESTANLNFGNTRVWHNEDGARRQAVAIGFYGDKLRVGYASANGYKASGAKYHITKADDRFIYELDGRPALEVYKQFLGDEAKNLPAVGLNYPLLLLDSPTDSNGIVRGLLDANEMDQSLTMAGHIPEGKYAQLMSADLEGIVDSGCQSAKQADDMLGGESQLAITVSCVGRMAYLDAATEKEIQGASHALHGCPMTGFYSFGEACPNTGSKNTLLHNHVMAVTTFKELP
ncbi:MAG: hypothetical protein CR974_00445 [Gammaproteobacteria bacterium]|nr:MAG: hypothetical protein CR974_00445 [Gammaproteobacteria bacterium]